MVVTSTRDPAATPASDAAVDARYTSVLVPLDGSDSAERALVPAQRLAKSFDAAVHLVARVRAIVAAARGLDPCIICLATHGRSRSAAIVGSTFARIAAERVGPLVAVGPRVATSVDHADAPGHLVVCLDGTTAGIAYIDALCAGGESGGSRVAHPGAVRTAGGPRGDHRTTRCGRGCR